MHTKIIATLGPATDNKDAIRQLVEAGARIFRLNFSHASGEKFVGLVSAIRELEREMEVTLTILQDLSGPKIRTCDLGLGTLEVAKGDTVVLTAPGLDKEYGGNVICLDHPQLLRSLHVGDVVALSDGMLRFKVTERVDDLTVDMLADNSGIAPPRKGIAFPGKDTKLEALTAKDRVDLKAGLELGVDVVAMSYVQRADDIIRLKALMREYGREVPVIAKLERPQAIQNLDDIILESDGVMVARGDLGLECDLADLPPMQKRIIRACNLAAKPVIVATQMLLSMVSSPMPTRAETTDVANAILDGADCIMLSEETAIGHYPMETVAYMSHIGEQAEDYMIEIGAMLKAPADQESPAKFLAYAACLLADKTRAKAVVCHSTSGATTRTMAACRPKHVVFALAPKAVIRRFTNLSWGVVPVEPLTEDANHQERAEHFVTASPWFAPGDTVIVAAGQPRKSHMQTQTNVVKIFEK